MVKFLEREESTADKFFRGLGQAAQSIPDMIGQYEKSKSLEKIGSQLPENQKAIWDSLDVGMKEKLAPSIFNSLRSKEVQKGKDIETAFAGTPKYLKDFHPDLYDKPYAINEIAELAKKYAGEGKSKSEAYKAAVQEYRMPQERKQGSLQQEASKQEGPQGGWRDFFGQMLEKSQQEPVPQNVFAPLDVEKPGATLGALGLGAVAPFEEVARFQSPQAKQFMESLGFTYPEGSQRGKLVTEKLREKLHEGLSPEAIKGAQVAEFAGAALPVERLFTGLKVIGKAAGFIKNAEKFAAREGIEIAEATQRIAKEAEAAGIDLGKVAAGDKQESGKLFNLSNRIGKAPETATELRVARAEPKTKMFPKEERIATREAQLKSFPKYEAEIAQDAAERAARAEAKIPKTVKGMDAKRIRIHTAQKNLPVAEEGYRKAIARVRALEDEVAIMKGPKERVQGLLEASKSELKDAEFFLKQTMQNIAGGESRVGLVEMRKAAQDKMLKIADQIAAGEEIKLAKMDFNPEMVKEAQRLSKKKPLPAVKQDDFYQQVHAEYGNEYKKQLDRIEKQLKEQPKTLAHAENIRHLQKERDVLKKLIGQTEAERTIHRHKLALRETAERQKAKDRFAKLERQEGSPKVQKVAKERIEQAIRNPAGKEAEEVAASIGIKKEDLASVVKESEDFWKKAADKIAKDKGKGSSKTVKELLKMWETFKKEGVVPALLTPAGKQILFTVGQITLEEYLGRKVPYVVSLGGLVGAEGAGKIRGLISLAYRLIKDEYVKNQYREAVQKGNVEKIQDIRKKHKKLANEVSKELRSRPSF